MSRRFAVVLTVLAAAACATPGARRGAAPSAAELADRAALFLGEKAAAQLGLTVEAFAAVRPLGAADVQRFEATLKARADELGRCLPARASPPRGEALTYHPASAVVAADGAIEDVRLAGDHGAAAQACVSEALAAWVLAAPEAPGRVWFRVTGLGLPAPAEPPPPGPVELPRMGHPGCVERAVRVSRSGAGAWTKVAAVVMFAVLPDGAVSDFQVLEPLTLPTSVGRALERAVGSCEWIPGTAGGTPIAVWVILPVRWSR